MRTLLAARPARWAALAVAVLLSMPRSVFGDSDYWLSAADGSFNTGTNWSLGHPPIVTDRAFFNQAGTYAVSFPHGPTYQSNIASVFSGDVTFYSADPPNTETYTVTEARPWGGALTLGRPSSPINLSTSSNLTVQTGGILNVEFGSHCFGTYLDIGRSSNGTVIVDGLNSQLNTTTSGSNVGTVGGTGNLTYQNSATGNLPGTLLIAADLSGSTGHLTVQSGASLTVGGLSVGNGSSPASATVSGATSTCLVNGQLIVGAAGVVEVSNGGSLAATGLSGSSTSSVVRISDYGTIHALTLGGTGTSSYLFFGSIADDTGGPGSLTKVGSNTEWLKGSSTYSGGTTLSEGTLGL